MPEKRREYNRRSRSEPRREQTRPGYTERPATANASCARPPSRSPSAARARRTRTDRRQLGITQPSLGSASFQPAAWEWECDRWRFGFGHRGNASGGKLTSHDEALALGAANAIRWHSGSYGTEAIGSPLRNIHARDQQVGTAHQMEPANGLAAAPGRQVRGCCDG
jgi:hypothetical protein